MTPRSTSTVGATNQESGPDLAADEQASWPDRVSTRTECGSVCSQKPTRTAHGPRRSLSAMPATELDQIVNLCKRRGFVYPSAEIYGGFRSSYDYGPLGSLMLRNVKDAWVRTMVQKRDDVVLIDASILSPPQVWEASGHLANFTDPLVDCTKCKQRFREDHLEDRDTCPNCGAKGSFTEARAFNLMFKTQAGPVEGAGADVYLRPETAQGMFVNFANVLQTSRKKPPFGIAQVGKSFRNEITPGNFIFRTREFEQMELEFFVPPAEGPKWYEYWCNARLDWYVELGMPREMLRLRAARRRRAEPLLGGHERRRVPLPVGMGRARGDRAAHRLRPQAARAALRPEARLLRPGDERALRPVRHRAGGRIDAHDGVVPARRVRRGRDRRRVAHRAAPPPAPRAVQGRRPAAVEEGDAGAARAHAVRSARATATWSTTTTRSRSGSATAARTRSGRRCASRSTSTASRTMRSPSATGTRPSRCGSRSTRSTASLAGRLGF